MFAQVRGAPILVQMPGYAYTLHNAGEQGPTMEHVTTPGGGAGARAAPAQSLTAAGGHPDGHGQGGECNLTAEPPGASRTNESERTATNESPPMTP